MLSEPWDRQPGEPNLWFGRFDQYRALGSERTIVATCNSWRKGVSKVAKKTASSRWLDASRKWNWVRRAEAWDAHEHERAMREWEARSTQLRGQEWETAQQLIEKAQQMLKFPLATVERREEPGPDGVVRQVTIVNPGEWRLSDAAKMAEVASKLARLASEMETERQRVISDAELERILAGERAKLKALEARLADRGDVPAADAAPGDGTN